MTMPANPPSSEKPRKQARQLNGWALAALLLALVILASGAIIVVNLNRSPGIEITTVPAKGIEGKIYVSGAVNNPGLYPVFAGDTLQSIIQAAGGLKDGADAADIKLSVAQSNNETAVQKVDLNRAEAWLLEALPGVGEVKAQAVIQYRRQHGYFHDVQELLNVPGFSEGVFTRVKDLITVGE